MPLMGATHLFRTVVLAAAAAALYAGCATGGESTQGAAGAGEAGSGGSMESGAPDAPAEATAGAQGDADPEAAADAPLEGGEQEASAEAGEPDGTVADAPPDVVAEAAPDASLVGVMCGAETCSGTDLCCATADSMGDVTMACLQTCPAGSAVLSCDGPEDCPGVASFCCALVHLAPGSFPSCPIQTAAANCDNVCTTTIPWSCPADGNVRLCHSSADCDSQGPNCCLFQQGNSSATFCADDGMKFFATKCF
jgi:hypothetical protein